MPETPTLEHLLKRADALVDLISAYTRIAVAAEIRAGIEAARPYDGWGETPESIARGLLDHAESARRSRDNIIARLLETRAAIANLTTKETTQ